MIQKFKAALKLLLKGGISALNLGGFWGKIGSFLLNVLLDRIINPFLDMIARNIEAKEVESRTKKVQEEIEKAPDKKSKFDRIDDLD